MQLYFTHANHPQFLTAAETSPAETLSAFSCDSFQNSGLVLAFVPRQVVCMVDPAGPKESIDQKGVEQWPSLYCIWVALHGHRYMCLYRQSNTVPL